MVHLPGRLPMVSREGVLVGDFRRLVAWQKANAYALAVHAAFQSVTHSSPGLRGQILRAVSSIADNLAEGCAKRSRRELARFAEMAYASAKEVENQLIRARGLGILSRTLSEDLLWQGDEVSRLCYGLSIPPSKTGSEKNGGPM
jgi:four helix bundle protein